MALTKIPPYNVLNDQQWIQVSGPDSLLSGFQYDSRTRSLWQKESQIANPGFHGVTHIAEDPVPAATCDTPGLMSADDKCKMDALAQTRLGVLGFQGAGFCVIPGCRVLLSDGTHKPIEMVAEGDTVIDRNGLPRAVQKTFSRDIDELVYRIECRGHRKGGLKLTGDHRVLAIKRDNLACVRPECKARVGIPCRHSNRNCDGCAFEDLPRAMPQWITAKELCVGDFVASRHSPAAVVPLQHITVADHIAVRIRDGRAYTIAKHVQVYGTPHDGSRICTTSKTNLPEKLPLTPDILKLFGYYLAEGSAGTKRLSFAIHSDELVEGDIGGEIQRIMYKWFGVLPRINRDDTAGVELTYHHATLARLIGALFGHSSKTKRIPRFLMELQPKLQEYLIAGVIGGDGSSKDCYDSKNISLQLANQELVEQIAALIERCGGKPSLYKPQSRLDSWQLKKGMCVERTSYCLTVQASSVPWLWRLIGREVYLKPNRFVLDSEQGQYQLHEVREITTEQYHGKVYDLAVEGEHSYITNGVVIHNSDDGGWMSGDIILAAGSEFISLERFGNVIRFTCDAPIPLNCTCEACAQIYWVQDETEVAAIRPPSCAGKLPGIDGYGELKIYLMPQSTIVDPANPTAVLNTKGLYPSLIFKRYDDSITPGEAELDLVLKRDPYNASVTEIGWAFTPGASTAVQCYWSMGKDSDGNIIRFNLNAESAPGILGSLLYNGHLLTKRMAVITDYTTQVLSTNQYTCKWWDIVNSSVADNESFTATNIWQYAYPEGGVNTKELVLDRTIGLLDIGTLVDIWFFKLGEVNGVPIRRHYFSCRPSVKAENIWSEIGGVEFGNSLTARLETSGGTFVGQVVSDIRNFEDTIWGLTGFNTPLYLLETDLGTGAAGTFSTAGGAVIVADLSQQYRARVDLVFPGLVVEGLGETHGKYTQRPVCLWNRHEISACLATIALARPLTDGVYPPYDILLSAPIDSYDEVYATVIGKGDLTHDAGFYVILDGVDFADLPESGTIRVLTGIPDQTGISSLTWEYTAKTLVGLAGYNGHIALIGSTAYQGNVNDVVELLHQEYNSPCVRVKIERTSDNKVNLQCMVGTLDMTVAYDADMPDDLDDMVRGLAPGYAVSGIYTQDAPFTGIGVQPAVNVDGLVIFDGGMVTGTGGQEEFWNELEIMQRGGHVWIWWNGLLIPPSATASAILPTPVTVSTLYFPITRPGPMGKFGMRMFPGCVVRRVLVRDNNRSYDEFTRGQVGLVMG